MIKFEFMFFWGVGNFCKKFINDSFLVVPFEDSILFEGRITLRNDELKKGERKMGESIKFE